MRIRWRTGVRRRRGIDGGTLDKFLNGRKRQFLPPKPGPGYYVVFIRLFYPQGDRITGEMDAVLRRRKHTKIPICLGAQVSTARNARRTRRINGRGVWGVQGRPRPLLFQWSWALS